MAEVQTQEGGAFDWKSQTFDLLKFGISKRYDSERREEIQVTDKTAQHQANFAGDVQKVGTTQNSNPIKTAPKWVQWTAIGGVSLIGLGFLAKAMR